MNRRQIMLSDDNIAMSGDDHSFQAKYCIRTNIGEELNLVNW